MKKIATFLLFLICAFSMVVFSACDEKYNFNFTESYIEMSLGQTMQLPSMIEVDGVTLKDLDITSLDSSVVSVQEDTITAVGVGSTFVQAKFKDSTSHIEIKVLGNAVVTEVPVGLTYDAQNDTISWNPVLLKIGKDIRTVNSYTVSIKNGDEVTETRVINDNKLELSQSGNLEIKVKCDTYSQNGEVIYRGSSYSEVLTVKKLSKAHSLSYNDQTKLLTWEAGTDVTAFRVKVNGVISDVITQKSAVIDLTSVNPTKQQVYSVSVISVDTSNIQNKVVIESESEELKLTRLFAPQMSISGGKVTWDNSQVGNFHYELTYTDTNDNTTVVEVRGGEYQFTGLMPDEYRLSLRAISESEAYLDSDNVSSLAGITKLSPITLLFNTETKIISVADYQDKTIRLFVKFKDEVKDYNMVNGEFNWESTESGTYQVYAYVVSQNDRQLTSDVSNTINIVQIPRIDSAGLTQKVENGKYFVEFTERPDTSYTLMIVDGDTLIKQDDNSYGNVDDLFETAKRYTIQIVASKANVGTDTYVLQSVTELTLVRQANLELTLVNDENSAPQSVTWAEILTASGYEYQIKKNGQPFASETITATNISLKSLDYGRYVVAVKAIGRTIDSVLYLDSLNYSQVDYSIEYTLETPTLSFDRQTRVLTVEKVNRALDYRILLGEEVLAYDGTKENIQIDLTSKITGVTTYVIIATALNNEDELIKKSEDAVIRVTVLSAPQKYSVTKEGAVSVKNPPLMKMLNADKPFDLFIDDVESTMIGDGNTFVVKAKFNANTEIVDGNEYYLDSDFSTFTIQRLEKPAKPVVDETVVSWEPHATTNLVYKLTVSQYGVVTPIVYDDINKTSIDIFDDLEYIDKSSDFEISIAYVMEAPYTDILVREESVLYFTSPQSDPTVVHKLGSDTEVVVSENDGVTIASWSESEVEEAEYIVLLDGEQIYRGLDAELDITEYCAQEGSYKLRLRITKQGYISSEYVQVDIERLTSPVGLKINEYEDVSITETTYTSRELQTALITYNDEPIYNLAEVESTAELKLQLIAVKNTRGTKYYLDSHVSTFQFSRLETLTTLTADENIITFDKIFGIDNYELLFENETISRAYKTTDYEVSVINNVDVKNIVDEMGDVFTVKVRAIVGDFVASKIIINRLPSIYSEAISIKKLSTVQELVVENSDSEDLTQSTVKISWNYSFDDITINRFVINIYKDGTLLRQLFATGTDNYILTQDMQEAGDYYVTIYAEGKEQCINSDIVTSEHIIRLAKVTELNITQNARLYFTGTQNTVKYVVYYNYGNDQNGSVETTSTMVTLSDLVENNFFGEVTIKVLALGDGGTGENRTLSSKYSDSLVVNKAQSSDITLKENGLVAKGESPVASNSKFLITITQNNRVVKELEYNYDQEYLFEDFIYSDNQEQVPTNQELDFVITTRIMTNKSNYILSDATTKTFTRLPALSNAGFKREENDFVHYIWFYVDKIEHATKYIAVIEGEETIDNEGQITKGPDYIIDEFVGDGSYQKFALTADIYEHLGSQWTIKYYAMGKIITEGDGTNYVNGSALTISGKKLSEVQNLRTQNGQLAWDQISLASDYALKVTDELIYTGYVNDGIHTTKEKLTNLSGGYSINIKAIGNITTELTTQNIVLDSQFLASPYSCTKLPIVTDLRVNSGYIAFKKVALDEIIEREGLGNVQYYAVIDSNKYLLNKIQTEQSDYIFMECPLMYEMLSYGVTYELGVRVESSLSNLIYSDISETIKIKILDNTSRGKLRVELGVNSTDPIKYDYTKSYVVWDNDPNALYGYNLLVDDELIKVENNINRYQIDSDGVMEAGEHTFRLALAGSNSADEDGVYILNSPFGEILTYTKLSVPTLYVLDGKLVWKEVEGAYGYLVYLDGQLVSGQDPVNEIYLDYYQVIPDPNAPIDDPEDPIDDPVEPGDESGDEPGDEPTVDPDEHGEEEDPEPYIPQYEHIKLYGYDYEGANLNANKVYDRYTVVAVPSNGGNFVRGNEGVYTDVDSGEVIPVTKLKSPTMFGMKDGALCWEDMSMDILDLNDLYTGKPIEKTITTTIDALSNGGDEIEILLQSTIDATHNYEYHINAEKMMFFDDATKTLINQYGATIGLGNGWAEKYTGFGWPSLNYTYFELGSEIVAGEYKLSLKQVGNNYNYLTSNYGFGREVYVPFAPSATLVYRQNQFYLDWSSVSIPTKYNLATKYAVFALCREEPEDEEGEVVEYRRIIRKDLTGTSLNLSELIQSGDIDDKCVAFGVYVMGDDVQVLNGKISNVINTVILKKTKAFVRNGELYWNEQPSASEYLITYTEENNEESGTRYVTVYEPHWDGKELSSSISNYYIKIQAIGVKVSSTTDGVLTGPNCDNGKLTKLATPQARVTDGQINWTDFANTTSYVVAVFDGEQQIRRMPITKPAVENSVVWFNNEYEAINHTFKFRAVGDLSILIEDSETHAYISSDFGSDIIATTVQQVGNVIAKGGYINWDYINNGSIGVDYYKLIFNKIDSSDTIIDSDIIQAGSGFRLNTDTCQFAGSDLEASRYQLTVQAYFTTADQNGRYEYQGQTAYYIMSIKSDVYTFEKYKVVHSEDQSGLIDNILIKDGEFNWMFTGDFDPENYNYELKITPTSGDVITIVQEENTFSGYVLDELKPTAPFELEIRVVAKDETEGYINSNYLKFKNVYVDNAEPIYQLNAVKETDFILGYIEDSQYLHVMWDSYNISTGDRVVPINAQYLLTYWTSEDETQNTTILTTTQVSTEIFHSNISEEYTLYYTVQVLPLGNQSYVASKPSLVREIQKPRAVSEVLFNPTEQYFTWATDWTSADHIYKIKDEILQIDSNGRLVLDEDDNPIVLRTYMFITSSNSDDRYMPIEMGVHRVGVAIVLKNSGIEGDFTYYYNVGNLSEKDCGSPVTVDLFTIRETSAELYGGTGTSNNPYIITTGAQFANIKYRLTRPSYQNSYTITINGVETRHTLTGKDIEFCFKQMASITVEPLGVGNITDIFNGTYDGNYNTISWTFNLENIPTSNSYRQYVSLFNILGTTAVVKNLKINASFTGSLPVGATIALVTYENRGTIQNVSLGNTGDRMEFSDRFNMYWYGVAQKNEGTITKVVNNYSVTMTHSTNITGISIGYAGITSVNNGTISQVANYGNIAVQTTRATVAGIVGNNNGTVTEAVLSNTRTDIAILKESREQNVQVTFGGIIAINDGYISFSYARTHTYITRTAPRAVDYDGVYIGGLIGESSNSYIRSCYVQNIITKDSQIEVGNVYVFIANLKTVTAQDVQGVQWNGYACYYNSDQDFAAVGGNTTGYTLPQGYPQGNTNIPNGTVMNDGESHYTTTQENSYPILRWERDFGLLWS